MSKSKAKECKEKRPIKHKLRVLLTVFLCTLLVLLTVTYITYLTTHKDKTRNSNTYNGNSSISLIEKNMIDAFSNTKDTGKFSFRLNDQDINEMLKNASNNVLPNNAQSIYYESKDNHHYFYIDLNPKLFVETRVVIDTFVEGITSDNLVVLQISKVSMGKLPYLSRSNYLNEEFFSNLSEQSLLPISYSNDAKRILINPTSLFEYFPIGNQIDILKDLVNSKPEIIKANGDSLFGFEIDFSSFKDSSNTAPDRSEEIIDLKARVESSITNEFIDSINVGKSKVACSFSLAELNAMLYEHINVFDKEIHESELTSNKCTLGITDFYAIMEPDNFVYRFIFSINGYQMYFDIKSEIIETNELSLKILTGTKCKCGELEFDLNSKVGKKFVEYSNQILTKFANKYVYMKYMTSNLSLTIDFSYLKDNIFDLLFCSSFIKMSFIDLIKFNFVIVKI